jgi:hypothetical protein
MQMEDYFFAFLAAGGVPAEALGLAWSPRTDFKGQTLNAGHFSHPATTAMGQSVMGFLA